MNLQNRKEILDALFYVFGFIFMTLCIVLIILTIVYMGELDWPYSWLKQFQLLQYLKMHTILFILAGTSIVAILALGLHIVWKRMDKPIYIIFFTVFLVLLLATEVIIGVFLVSVRN